MKSGFVAVIGRPNVGKSSIVNALVGQKVAIVSPKPQTTRDKIIGIYNDADCQIVFVDTPGVHSPQTKLGEYMMKSVSAASVGADLILIVADAGLGVLRQDTELVEKYSKAGVTVFFVYNKTDLVSYDELLPQIDKLKKYECLAQIIPVSCYKNNNLDILLKLIKDVLPQGEPFYPDDEYTDKSERYIIAETIREKILFFLQQEIPHGVQVVVENMNSSQGFKDIEALIVIEKESHKPILIGKGGAMLKKIGSAARKELEKMFDLKINLKTFVKVSENWRNKPSILSGLGFDKKG